jgi:hypothetical protein
MGTPTKYKIEIERISWDGVGKEWEWRVFINRFDDPAVTGGGRSAADAMYEALCYVDVDGFRDEFTVHSRRTVCAAPY